MKALCVLGIMSGTSIDSVDYALCAIAGNRVTLQSYWQIKFPARLQSRLHQAARGASSSHEVAQLHHDLGRFYAGGARRGLGGRRPDLVGMHGQTIFHHPDKKAPATFQLGEPAYLVEALQTPVVSNFRAADMAAGGEGAPLATAFHRVVFGRRGCHVCVNNLGGISNVTSLDWRDRCPVRILAFDTGPANVLIDLAMRFLTKGAKHFDRNGAWARRGVPSEKLLAAWLEHPYFAKNPPKSTGRELFGELFLQQALRQCEQARLSKFDAVATFTELTARSLALNYRLHLPTWPDRLILTGGGAANPVLVQGIRNQLLPFNRKVQVQTSAQLGWPLQSIEPAAFALLAYWRWTGKPGNIPTTTGAGRLVQLGQVSEPQVPPADLPTGNRCSR